MQLDVSDFLPADSQEKESLVVMRKSVSFWRDGLRRFRKNKIAMTSLIVIIIIMIFAFILPSFYPYSYEQQIRGSENLAPMQYSQQELELIAQGQKVFPHILGTDSLGRDIMIRLMIGSRVSLLVGIVASVLVLLIGSLYGSIAGYFGGKVDMIMMRLVDIIYTVPDILIIILLMVTLKYPLESLANNVPGFDWINTIGGRAHMYFYCVLASLLGWDGQDHPKPDTDTKGAGIRNSGESIGSKPRQDNKEAPSDQLHGYVDRNDHIADTVIHFYGKLPKLYRHRRCGTDAVTWLDGFTGHRGDNIISLQTAGTCYHDQPDHPFVQSYRGRAEGCLRPEAQELTERAGSPNSRLKNCWTDELR